MGNALVATQISSQVDKKEEMMHTWTMLTKLGKFMEGLIFLILWLIFLSAGMGIVAMILILMGELKRVYKTRRFGRKGLMG